MIKKIIISFIAALSFGIVDVFNIFFIEDYLHPYIQKWINVDKETLSIISGSLAATVSIITAIFVESYLSSKYNYIRYPFIDALGLIIGTVIFLFGLKLYYKLRKNYLDIKHYIKKEERYID
jgi:hypothetical protein